MSTTRSDRRKASMRSFRAKTRARRSARVSSMVRKDRSDYRITPVIRADHKITDVQQGSTSITNAGAVYNLMSSIVAGSGYKNNYIGREIQPAGLDIRLNVVGALSNAFAAADLNNMTKIIVFQWMDDAVPTIATVLEGSTPVSPIEFNNYNNIEVLYEEIFPTWVTVYDSGSTYGSSNSYNRRIYIKGKKMRNIEFNSTTGGIAKGALYMAVISDSSIAPSPTFSFYSRLTFLDA